MVTNKPIFFNATVVLLVIIGITTLVEAQWAVDDDGCRTPRRGVGTCIMVKNCRPMLDIIQQLHMPTQEVIAMLRSYHCGFQGRSIKVCCPNRPITLGRVTGKGSTVVPVDHNIANHKNLHLLPRECGISPNQHLITYGNTTSLFEFPWMALFYYETEFKSKFLCAGTLITDMYVLTAAHCLTNLGTNKLLGVRFGEHNTASDIDCEKNKGSIVCAPPVQDIEIARSIPHPQYNGHLHTHDIGLVRLASPVNINVANVKPICLPTMDSIRFLDFTGQSLIVTGWGITEKNDISPELLKVLIEVTSKEHCQRAYNRVNIRISNKQICAGGNWTDSCTGDSGGPLQTIGTLNDDLRFIQYGVVSYGSTNCGRDELPGIYTRVDHYLGWILNNMEP